METVKRAATLILIRNGERGLEVYMIKRPDSMLFLPGYYVFPGGVMQREDQDEELFASCADRRLGVELPYAVTAIRECFEEVGYLLADVPEASAFGETASADAIRREIAAKRMTFREWVLAEKIRLRTDVVRYYGHRITPRAKFSRRFDTRYFLTMVPPHVQLAPCEREVEHGEWMDPRTALDRAKRGVFKMAPPTMDALADLMRFQTAEDAFLRGEGVGSPRPHELA